MELELEDEELAVGSLGVGVQSGGRRVSCRGSTWAWLEERGTQFTFAQMQEGQRWCVLAKDRADSLFRYHCNSGIYLIFPFKIMNLL